MTCKTIFQGRLDFDGKKGYENALKMYQRQAELHYKNDILLKAEDVFVEAAEALIVPRQVIQGMEKSWRNTVKLLEFVAQYAVAGFVNAYVTDNGRAQRSALIEPKSERSVVLDFGRGRDLEEAKPDEAIEALDAAIDKYAKHAMAYSYRAYVNLRLQHYHDALRDFDKSIHIYDGDPIPYYGKGHTHLLRQENEAAIHAFDLAIQKAIPLQPVYWKARRMKAHALMLRGDWEAAGKEWKFFLQRAQRSDDPMHTFLRSALYQMGTCFFEAKKYKEASDCFEQAAVAPQGQGEFNEADFLLMRAAAKQKGYPKAEAAAEGKALRKPSMA